jgi:hypothetical protein
MNAAVAEDTIDRAGRALIDAVSAADRFAETVRLGRVLGRLLIPADVVVVSEGYAARWAPVKGTLVHEAMSQGQVIAES